MSEHQHQGFATRSIHEAYNPDSAEGALVPPLHLASTFTTHSANDLAARFAGEQAGHIYSRISNPTLDLLERRVASLEGAEAALSTASGMGAIAATLWTLLEPGDEVLVDATLYGCTFAFLHHGLAKFGVDVRHVDMTCAQNVAAAVTSKTKIVYFETPANPNMRLVDIEAVTAIAQEAGTISIVDNTYASPFITRPIDLGADLVIHSATKYLGGHGDLVAGLVAGRREVIDSIRANGLKDMTGAALAPFNAMLILRGLKTLSLRMREHSRNAMLIARYLEGHPDVREVHYPGLESSPFHDLARRQMREFGGMIAFELEGGIDAGKKVIDNLGLIQCAVSLGDAESLIQHPATMTHSTYSAEERLRHGISDGLVRLSVGLEDSDDLLADLDQALSKANKKRRSEFLAPAETKPKNQCRPYEYNKGSTDRSRAGIQGCSIVHTVKKLESKW